MIEIQSLHRRVAGMTRPLLDIASFAIHAGDRIGIQGPSGSGKSTFLRAIAMLDPCDRCDLKFRDVVITQETVTAYRREVIYLPQHPALVPATVRDNMTLPFRIGEGGSNYQEDRVVRMLEQLGKPAELLAQSTDSLSGGEKQIVSLVRALQLDPKVILLDEPTASLDPESTRRIEEVVCRWQEDFEASDEDRAFVIVSHHAEQIERLSNRKIAMDEGRVSGSIDA